MTAVHLPVHPPPPTRWPAGVSCPFCRSRTAGPIVDAGGTVGLAHRSCFIAWDRGEETAEHQAVDRDHQLAACRAA